MSLRSPIGYSLLKGEAGQILTLMSKLDQYYMSEALKEAKKAFEQLERGEPLEKERKKRSATDGSSINDIDLF